MATFPSKVNYATGDILTATNMNDIGGAINLLESAQFAAGKNKIINGDFGVWQRGTSFTASGYNADRWSTQTDTTFTTSQQTFTAGTAPVAGYEGQYFYRLAKNAGGTYIGFTQRIEDVRTLAGQTVTLSLWAKADSATTLVRAGAQNFGSGGSSQVNLTTASQAITTSWARYSFTFTLPSISGKTVGTSSYLEANLYILETGAKTLDIWGVQLEAASTASNFQTATGTKQGELAACQRYYYRQTASSNAYTIFGLGGSTSSTQARFTIAYPVTMRVAPTSVEYSTIGAAEAGSSVIAITGVAIDGAYALLVNVASGLTQYRSNFLYSNNSTSGYIGFSAEL